MVSKRRVDGCFEEIHEMLRRGKLPDVLGCILDQSTWTVLAPYDVDLNHAWYVVGDVFFRERQYAHSIRAFERAIEEWPEDIDAYLALANAHTESHDPREACRILLRAHELASGDDRVTYNLGNAYFDLGEFSKANFYYEEAYKSSDPEIRELSRKNTLKLKRAME